MQRHDFTGTFVCRRCGAGAFGNENTQCFAESKPIDPIEEARKIVERELRERRQD